MKLLPALAIAAVLALALAYWQAAPQAPSTQACYEGDSRQPSCNGDYLSFEKCVGGKWVKESVYCPSAQPGSACSVDAAQVNGKAVAGCANPGEEGTLLPPDDAPGGWKPSKKTVFSADSGELQLSAFANASCGDGYCSAGGDYSEDCVSCPSDCGCEAGEHCSTVEKACVLKCGDGRCEARETDCCGDCGCAAGKACDAQSSACFQPAPISEEDALSAIKTPLATLNVTISNFNYEVADELYNGAPVKVVTLTCKEPSKLACQYRGYVNAGGEVVRFLASN